MNGNTLGASATPTGNWDATANWNSSSTGTGGTLAGWTANNNAMFSAGTDAVNPYTVTLTTGISVSNITFSSGAATVTGNTLTLNGAGGSTINVATGLTGRIDSLLAGSAALNKTGAGTLTLGSNTFNSHTGAINVTAGTLELAKTAAVGAIDNAAAVTVAGGATLSFNGTAAYNIETIGSLSGAGTVQQVGAAAPFTLKINGAASTTFSGTITDGANNLNIEKNTGTGTLTLTGANSFDGTLLINAGTVNIQNATALGTTTGGTTVTSGAALELQGNIAVGAESLTLAGTGVGNNGALRNVSGTNSYAGNLTMTAATEIQSDAGSLTVSGSVTAANFGLTVDGAGNTNLGGTVGLGSGSLVKNGAGTLTLSGTNTYTGTTTINAGTVSINTLANVSGGASALGAPITTANGTIAIGSTTTGATLAYTGSGATSNRVINLAGTTGGATLDASGTGALVLTSNLTATGAGSKTLTLTGSNTAANTLSGAIVNNSGTNITSLVKSGAGTWALSGTNTFTGSTTINAGTLSIGADSGLGTAPAAATANQLVFNGGTLNTSNTFTLNANRGTTVNAGGGSFDTNAGTTLTYNGILAGAGALNKSGTGTLIIGGATTNTHTGDINVNAGTLEIAKTTANSAIGDSAKITIASGAVVNFDGTASETIGSLAGAGTFNKLGGSTLTISAASAFGAGTFNLNAGTVDLTADQSFGTFNLSGGTLKLSSATNSIANLNITTNSFIDFGGAAATLNVTSLSITAGVTLNIINWVNAADFFFATNWTSAAFDTTGANPMNQVVFNSPTFNGSNTKWLGYGNHEITPVPEPAAYGAGLLAVATGMLFWRRRGSICHRTEFDSGRP